MEKILVSNPLKYYRFFLYGIIFIDTIRGATPFLPAANSISGSFRLVFIRRRFSILLCHIVFSILQLNVSFLRIRKEEAAGASLRTRIKTFKSSILCRILHSFPYFFITVFPTAFSLRSRMTGRYLILFCKKPFFVSAHAYPFRQLSLKL